MYFTPAQLTQLQDGYGAVAGKYFDLLSRFQSFSSTHLASSEYALHGFLRRLGTLQRCIDNVYSLYAPDRSDIPSREACVDLAINLQSFIFNVFGCLDNLAWIWVTEKQLKTAKGKPLAGSLVGFRMDVVLSSYSTEFRAYLDQLNDWFEYLENYRHALAHRIPIYVPPFVVNPANESLYNNLENQKNEAAKSRDFQKYDRLDAEQEKLGKFDPVMTHSFNEAARPVVFHIQMLADWNTVVEIAERFLKQPDW
jgi:hypothetical protein